jgi:hypothetical protein
VKIRRSVFAGFNQEERVFSSIRRTLGAPESGGFVGFSDLQPVVEMAQQYLVTAMGRGRIVLNNAIDHLTEERRRSTLKESIKTGF